jgi:hypothetical protein
MSPYFRSKDFSESDFIIMMHKITSEFFPQFFYSTNLLFLSLEYSPSVAVVPISILYLIKAEPPTSVGAAQSSLIAH